jgi:hypothetical protein
MPRSPRRSRAGVPGFPCEAAAGRGRVTAALRPLADGLWVAERPFRALPLLDIGTRMTVVRGRDGGLVLHSPVEADAATREAVGALGAVRAVVCPNKVHHLFAGGWKRAFPEARLLGPPGLAEKRRDLAFDGVLGDDADPAFAGALESHLVGGIPYMNEVAFLHAASRTLLLTDLAFHPTPASSPGLRRWTRLTRVRDGFGPNAVVRFLIRDRAALRASLDRILAWDFDRVTVTHGDVLAQGGRDALRRAWSRLR